VVGGGAGLGDDERSDALLGAQQLLADENLLGVADRVEAWHVELALELDDARG
jgi:hypothetical protein